MNIKGGGGRKRRLAAEVVRGVAELLFPGRCALCGQVSGADGCGLCVACYRQVRYIQHPLCVICGNMFSHDGAGDHLCEECLRQPPPFACARSLTIYENSVRQLLHNLKYRFDTTSIPPLAKIARSCLYSGFESCEIVVPVPLHLSRLRKRGMNQSLVLARMMFPEKRSSIRVDVLFRNRFTHPQSSLAVAQRKRNLRGAFSVKHPEIIQKKKILLVDDVYTTGTTVKECCSQLLHCGAAEVRVLTFARVIKLRT